MIKLSMSVKESADLRKRLKALDGALKRACLSGLGEGLRPVLDDARALCPTDSAALRESLFMRLSATPEGAEGIVAAGAKHAPYVELGTFRSPPKPFLAPAFHMGREGIVSALARAIEQEVE